MRVAAGRSHICKGSTCNNDQMQHGHCSRYMEALRLGREEKMTRRGQGSGVEGDAPGPKSQQAELSLRGRNQVACSKEDGFVCLCANIYIYSGYTGA